MRPGAGVPGSPGVTGQAGRPVGPVGPVGSLGRACAAVDEAATTMWAARSGRELIATVEAVARLRAKLDGLELAVAAELESGVAGQQALKDDGWASAEGPPDPHRRRAPRAVVPRRSGWPGSSSGLPAVAEALADGWLSRTKAHIVAAAVERLPQDASLRERARRR